MTRSVILLSLVTILNSCNNSKKVDFKPTSMHIEIIDSSFFHPFNLTAFENFLLLTGESENGLIQLYDPEKRKIIFSGYKRGRGPEEMLGPSSVQVRQNSHIWIYDITLGQFNRFIYSKDSLKLKERLKINQRVLSPNFISDSTIIAINLLESSKGWVPLFDSNGNYIKSLVGYPVNNNDLPDPVFTESYQGRLLIKPDIQKFVIACRLTDRLSIYDVKGEHISTFRSENPFEPIIVVDQTPDFYIMGQNEETKIGFPAITISNDFIFALFSGKSRKTLNPTFSNKIYQLTWTGKLVAIYETDLSIINFDWSEYHRCLYMFATDNNNHYLGKLALDHSSDYPKK